MFCVREHPFDIEPKGGSLSAFIGPKDGLLCNLWSLSVRAVPRTIVIPEARDESPIELSPQIQLHSLRFAVTDWRRLAGTRHTLPPENSGAWLLHTEWEPFAHLELAFGVVRDRSIVVELNGIGLQEGWPELLGSEVPFSASASVLFEGVGLDTPPNVTDPVAHSLSRLRHCLPDYRFEAPRIAEYRHDGVYYGSNVHFPPAGD
jgi:hypothetical protein